MFNGMEAMTCPNLAVAAQVMQHVVHVESGANPYAIGVVGGHLVRQPRTLAEALATVRMLDAGGYNFSVGLTQVNRTNLVRYGLNTYPKAFEPCANLAAGARILSDCYKRANSDWGKAFSCYYSGNFVSGYHDGYVQRVYASIRGDISTTPRRKAAVVADRSSAKGTRLKRASDNASTGDAKSRVAMRTLVLDAVPATMVAAMRKQPSVASAVPAAPHALAAPAVVPKVPVEMATLFEPVVRGPDDPATSTAQPEANGPADPAAYPAAHTHTNQESGDAAFVF